MRKAYNLKIHKLISKGVCIQNPCSVEIGGKVDNNKISSDKVIINGKSRIFGKNTLLSKGVCLGFQEPTTIINCRLGLNVSIGGGCFENSIFMDNVFISCGNYFRSGTILEEFSRVASSVGLKNTILFPYIKIGSLVNFCDIFMSGGISDHIHGEIGASYVHFNYTPHSDKATTSLLGDVVRGIFLRKKPIFLGGNGGIIGPSRVNYGTIVKAGLILKGNYLHENDFVFRTNNFVIKKNKLFSRKVVNNIIYLSNIIILLLWYRNVRTLYIYDKFSINMVKSLLKILEINLRDTVLKFVFFLQKIKYSFKIFRKKKDT